MSKKLVSWVVVGSVIAIALAACGSDDRSGFGTDDPDAGSSGSTGNGSSSSGPIGTSTSSSGGDDGGLGQCGAESKAAAQLPVDILVMLDASGSMMEQTGPNANGPTKWVSVKDALKGFINDPKSAGLGVGLQIFPIKQAGAPATCSSNAQCNVGGKQLGRCFLKACVPPNNTTPLQSCDTAADCPGNAPCRQYGDCLVGPISVGNCLVGDANFGCGLLGTCTAVTTSTCDGVECVEDNYKPAKVAVNALPGNAGPLITAIDTIPNPPPDNLTPTRIAVKTGIDLAKTHLTANPKHKVVHVLATDGLPTTCGPSDNASIAAIAKTGADQGINTFVIGVFADAQKAQGQATTDAIAAAGGTGKAFIISSGANVTQDFQKALDAIRGSALPCEYEIPKSTKGEQDFTKVNVQRTSGGKSEVLPNKKSAQDCGTGPGWYYDKDPAAGTPTKIILCPNTCDAVKKDTTGGAKLDILLGCKTVVK